MASRPAPIVPLRARGSTAEARVSAGAVGLAGAVPFIFLHANYQPTATVTLGSLAFDVTLADLAIAMVAVAAIVSLRVHGAQVLRPASWVLTAAGVLIVLVLAQTVLPAVRDSAYPWHEHLVTALKFCEYMVLLPAVPLLLRGERDSIVFVRVVVAWSAVATAWAVLQLVGLVDNLQGRRPWQREPSFVGIHDFAALSGTALAIAFVALALGSARFVGRRTALLAGAAGALGIVLSGAMTAVAGIGLAAAALLIVAWRRGALHVRALAAVVAVLVAVGTGTAAMRASAFEHFAEFVGLREARQSNAIESYAQRTVLAYIGLRIWADHPILGVGWQASNDQDRYGPYVADARRRFPSQPAGAFPSPAHPWGVQNAYIQTLADMGIVGLAALAAVLVAGVATALRATRSLAMPLVGLAWLLVAVGIWNGLGVFAGIPLDAVTWLALGLAAVRVGG